MVSSDSLERFLYQYTKNNPINLEILKSYREKELLVSFEIFQNSLMHFHYFLKSNQLKADLKDLCEYLECVTYSNEFKMLGDLNHALELMIKTHGFDAAKTD